MKKKILFGLLAVFVIIQAFRPEKNINTSPSAAVKDISTVYKVNPDVAAILKNSCYDCHSNNTRYPWYNNVQPIAWWLDDHIEEGKKELNFNEFASYAPRRQYRKLEEVIDEVKEGEMPLKSYSFIHTQSKLTEEQRVVLTSWADGIRKQMESTYPADSLKRK